ncbi:Muscle-specific 20 [Paramuricea clavata]|nr:Muscle-specific 20 [Paramuricea clavata]
MAERPRGFGMTAELQKKKAGKYDPELEKQAIEFITSTTGQPLPGGFHESLKDGIILCNLANALKPGSIKKINESKMAFKMMENISNFLTVCQSLGVNKIDIFQTVDLYEAQNIPLVIYF